MHHLVHGSANRHLVHGSASFYLENPSVNTLAVSVYPAAGHVSLLRRPGYSGRWFAVRKLTSNPFVTDKPLYRGT